MRDELIEIARDLPAAMFTAFVVGMFTVMVLVWSGLISGVL